MVKLTQKMGRLLSMVCLWCWVGCCFAVGNERYPWYFKVNRVEDCWDLGIDGKRAVVTVLDSKVAFIANLKGKECFSNSYVTKDNIPDETQKMHGTAMASLIAGDRMELPCDNNNARSTIQQYCNGIANCKVPICGIAPKAKIINGVFVPKGNLKLAVLDAMKNRFGLGIRLKEEEVRTTVINLSGGTKIRNDSESVAEWRDLVLGDIEHNPNFLVVGAVGNDGIALEKNTGIAPQMVIPSSFSKKRDPFIRVGAVGVYDNNSTPKIDSSSNYGEGFVDILAPGQDIPALTPSGEVAISGGTSEAAAIVSGAIALMVSCRPSMGESMANNIRQALLDSARKENTLTEKVKNGRVLDIYSAVNRYCIGSVSARIKEDGEAMRLDGSEDFGDL